jgi:phage gpG-like protein
VATLAIRRIPNRIRRNVVTRLRLGRVGDVLVSQARDRIDNKGDSETTFPELWKPKSAASFREGGTPLRDDGNLYRSLTSKIDGNDSRVVIRLVVPGAFRHALSHQNGFETKGPNFIPLTVRAKEAATKFAGLVRALSRAKAEVRRASGFGDAKLFLPAINNERKAQERLEAAGFVEGETYIMAWNGVKVPARKIFNLPPENVEELRDAIVAALA